MANQIFANGREIACKAGAGKTICAMPDVCFTPPENPATPPGVPVPYPNTGLASDTTEGSKSVMISGKEIMLKNKSYFKTSSGDEAGCAAKKGVITSKNTGKVYFNAWSMDVKFEGENVDRHLDLTTNNHASLPGNNPPWPFTDSMTDEQKKDCEEDKKKEEVACSTDGMSLGDKTKYKIAIDCCADANCQTARNCMLVPYLYSGSPRCCQGKTAHHLLPNSLLQVTRGNFFTNVPGLINTLPNAYNDTLGACVCVSGASHSQGDHGELHKLTQEKLAAHMMYPSSKQLTYEIAKEKVVEVHNETFLENGSAQCKPECLKAQIDASLSGRRQTGVDINVRQMDGKTVKNYNNHKNKPKAAKSKKKLIGKAK